MKRLLGPVACLAASVLGGVVLRDPGPRLVEATVDPCRDGVDFLDSQVCARCHANHPSATAMRDSYGAPVGMYDLWQSSMMANASRDPYWRAAVAAEIAATPSRASEIAAKCMRCHAPMASPDGHGDTEYEMSLDVLHEGTRRSELAADGVSCSVCHMIDPAKLGTEASFSGGFEINDLNETYGPHQNLVGGAMLGNTGLNPVYGAHLTSSALCASCHTLSTKALQPDGRAVGVDFLEQAPYLEWRNSDFQNEVVPFGPDAATCQECHMPQQDARGPISTRVARRPNGSDFPNIPPRSPYGKHVFVGGNTLMPRILRDNAASLGVVAPPAAFDATVAAARDQLRNRTADVSIISATRTGGLVDIEVEVQNRCGHKFPSGYPSRRAWLRLRVLDASGNVLFASGGFDADGRLLDGGTGQVLASEAAGGAVLPHRDVITAGDQVQVYGVVMEDGGGQVTWRLLHAARYRRDNRLLPKGWSAGHPEAGRTQPFGVGGDANFAAGGDRVRYRVPVSASGALTVEAELYYQSIEPRHVEELRAFAGEAEVAAFLAQYAAVSKAPELVGRDVRGL